jgi:hypothetical protein
MTVKFFHTATEILKDIPAILTQVLFLSSFVAPAILTQVSLFIFSLFAPAVIVTKVY